MTTQIVVLFPELLGTYGDGGNAVVLAQRLRWRGLPCELTTVAAHDPIPDDGGLYLLGGGEDGPQEEAARRLGRDGPLHAAVHAGATVLAVCAGMQIAGASFPGADGRPTAGLGLLDCETLRTDEPRAVGELLVDADARLGLAPLTGFENHGGRTRLGDTARPLGTVVAGVGNGSPSRLGDGPATEGAVCHVGAGHVVGTYLHGPVLARNPELADLLLRWVLGDAAPDLAPLDDHEHDELREKRLQAATAGHLDGVTHRTWRDRLLRRN
jgi:CobQ-like glutamine amidotransferase family enzyme